MYYDEDDKFVSLPASSSNSQKSSSCSPGSSSDSSSLDMNSSSASSRSSENNGSSNSINSCNSSKSRGLLLTPSKVSWENSCCWEQLSIRKNLSQAAPAAAALLAAAAHGLAVSYAAVEAPGAAKQLNKLVFQWGTFYPRFLRIDRLLISIWYRCELRHFLSFNKLPSSLINCQNFATFPNFSAY